MDGRRALGLGLIALGAGAAASAILGPLVLGAIRFHVSETMENQAIGGDIVSLGIVAPVAILAGLLWLRGHALAPVLALAPSLYALYFVVTAVLGVEYHRYPGNSEKFFPPVSRDHDLGCRDRACRLV